MFEIFHRRNSEKCKIPPLPHCRRHTMISRLETSVVQDATCRRARHLQRAGERQPPGPPPQSASLRGRRYPESAGGVAHKAKRRSKSIYDGFISSRLTLDKDRPICARSFGVSQGNVAPRGVEKRTRTHRAVVKTTRNI